MTEKYLLLDKLKLCHRCEKAKQAPHKKFCFDCLDKIREYNAKRYDSEKAKQYQARRRELYNEHKKNGVCVRCKKKATHGLYCYECSLKAKKRNARTAERRKNERYDRGLIPQMRIDLHLCLRCGNAVEQADKKLCNKCIEQNAENSKLADKSYFRSLESARIENVKYNRSRKRWGNDA